MPIREVVSQISPPIRILLVLTVAVLGVYMLFLRPKPEEIPPLEPSGPSVTQPGQVRDAAEDAVDAANDQLAQQESVDGVDAGESAAATQAGTKKAQPGKAQAGAAAEPAQDLKGLPKPLRKAIRDDKILVVLFSNRKSYDDKAVEKALTKVNKWDGKVYVHTAPLRKISRYGRIARGVNVEQSPTVVVADHTLKAETLVGYVDRGRIDQAVVDARRNTTGLYVDSYLKAVDKVCFAHSNRWDSVPSSGNLFTPRKLDREMAEASAVFASFAADFKAIDAPKKWQAFRAATIKDLDDTSGAIQKLSVSITPKSKWTDIIAAAIATISAGPAEKRANERFAAANLPRCGRQF